MKHTPSQQIHRIRRTAISLLLTIAVMVAITKVIPFWAFIGLVIYGCWAFFPGGLVDRLLNDYFIKKNDRT